ncbi:glutathione S-transferase 3-like [Ylistrum balloti]|uniref:glutathione S-transferase 3-like n=1 Tax=Ylistrum balloti TaxID=509963 RepID=UPI0029058CDA|nr:glutathione S-transferase 3-like [Ylistrum balloti]
MPPKPAGKPKYRLTYFNVRARGELSRLLFNQAGVDFEDVRIEQDKWPALKKEVPGGTLPVLTYDGKQYGQSMAIARYLASEFGLYGKTNLDRLMIDEILCDIVDLITKIVGTVFEKDEAKKAELTKSFEEEILPAYLKKHEAKIGKSGWLVGESITAADLGVFDTLDGITKRGGDKCLDGSPKVKALMEKVRTQPRIKAYLAKRPDSQI